MSEVVVVGSYVQDLAFSTPVFPSPGETRIGTFRAGPGGKGFNQAVACNRQGIDTLFVGAVGNDIFADGVRDFIASEKLRAELEVCADQPTGAASIVVNENAQNLIVVALGANDYLSTDHINRFHDDIARARYLVCQVENNIAATERALEIGQNTGTTTILNPAPINNSLTRALLQSADIITPNETEFVFLMAHVLNRKIPDDFWLEDDASIHAYCCQANVATVILTLGDKGCFVSHNKVAGVSPAPGGKAFYRVPAITVEAVDTTGAGDAFNGGLAAGLCRYPDDFRRAIQFANTVAGLSTTRHGTAPAMPSQQDVEAWQRGKSAE